MEKEIALLLRNLIELCLDKASGSLKHNHLLKAADRFSDVVELVLALDALEKRDFKEVRSLLSDELSWDIRDRVPAHVMMWLKER